MALLPGIWSATSCHLAPALRIAISFSSSALDQWVLGPAGGIASTKGPWVFGDGTGLAKVIACPEGPFIGFGVFIIIVLFVATREYIGF